jgi:ABC-type uncharacterized transport system substrate-binding protein
MPISRPSFVRLKPDVIVGAGTEAAIAARQATSSIPIVFPTAGDPIGSGLVASLARPGGNVTGLSNLGTDLAAKRIEILREVFPGLSRLAVMANANYSGGVTERVSPLLARSGHTEMICYLSAVGAKRTSRDRERRIDRV